jgi:cystathionine gamma-synthase
LLALLLLPAGALVVAPHDCYGGTYRLIKGLEEQSKLRALFIDQNDDAAFAAAMENKPTLLWIETPSNHSFASSTFATRRRAGQGGGALVLRRQYRSDALPSAPAGPRAAIWSFIPPPRP